MSNTSNLKLHQQLTSLQVKKYFPGAIEANKREYQFSLDENREGFIEQFETDSVDELVEEIIDYYVVKKPWYAEFPGEFSVSFTEPGLGTNVSFEWDGKVWQA